MLSFTQYKNVNLDDKKISKSNFYKNKKSFNIHDLYVNKILVAKKESYGTKSSLKYFIGYNNDDVIRLLSIKFPQMVLNKDGTKHLNGIKHFDSNKTMSFKASDNKLLKKYTKIWEKIAI